MYRLNVCYIQFLTDFLFSLSLFPGGPRQKCSSCIQGAWNFCCFQKWSPSIPSGNHWVNQRIFFNVKFLYHEKTPKIYTSSLHLTQLRKPSDEQNCWWVVTFPWFAIFCWEGEIQPPTLTLTTHLPGGRSRDICSLKKQRWMYLNQSDSHAKVLALAFLLHSCSSSYRQSQASIPLGLKMGWS